MDTGTTSTAVTDSDRRALRDLVTRAQESQDDVSALMALHTPDAVVVNVAGRRVLGREAFREAMAAALASPLSHVRTTLEVLDIRFPATDVAVVSCAKTVHDGRADADRSTALPATGALTYVMVRSAGAWRVALAQTTPTLG